MAECRGFLPSCGRARSQDGRSPELHVASRRVEHDLIVHARKREHAEAVCGLLNFLSEFYHALRQDAETPP